MRNAGEKGIDLSHSEMDDFSSLTGKGVKASIHGKVYHFGSLSLFKDLGVDLTVVNETVHALQAEGKTVMLLGTEEDIEGLIAARDGVREHVKKVIQSLHAIGIDRTVMLTGDNEATTQVIGKQLGITDVKAELLPEGKLTIIKQLREIHTKVAMVGDSVNDAPALLHLLLASRWVEPELTPHLKQRTSL